MRAVAAAFSFWASTKESLGKFKLVRAVRHNTPFLDADGGKPEFIAILGFNAYQLDSLGPPVSTGWRLSFAGNVV
ncbi:conserved hypothetical protein [Coccidioides posadasii str. Silveira]|uniref:Uncharacterized protein n=1 Tax=Coccidioides posadasii (strain RMSCC 757 / Silveira) TaxID=443226 RepID=E9CWS8_COCPS|nr:conserved hypothetical protein [Coccidioides posadasii str. Silveira]